MHAATTTTTETTAKPEKTLPEQRIENASDYASLYPAAGHAMEGVLVLVLSLPQLRQKRTTMSRRMTGVTIRETVHGCHVGFADAGDADEDDAG